MPVLVDAGPLIALIDRSDNAHARCRKALSGITENMLTVWPVVTEAMYLLSFSWLAQSALWDMIEREIAIVDLAGPDLRRMRELMSKYKDLPMDLADAAIVCAAEKLRIQDVFTIDRRDFNVYRPKGVNRFRLIPG